MDMRVPAIRSGTPPKPFGLGLIKIRKPQKAVKTLARRIAHSPVRSGLRDRDGVGHDFVGQYLKRYAEGMAARAF
jgi:hypothetical protein